MAGTATTTPAKRTTARKLVASRDVTTPTPTPPENAVFLSGGSPFAVTGSRIGEAHVPATIIAQFGQSKFDPAIQVADFSSQATRVLKDVLSVGRWKAGIDPETGQSIMLDVTPAMLQQIVENFRLAKSRQVNFNLGKGHGDPKTGLIHSDDLIAEMDDVATDGQSLWTSQYVSPEQAIYLSNKARKVSVGLRWNWRDGFDNIYPIQLVHVAVTDNPIVAGQGPFVRLANDPNAAAAAVPGDAGPVAGTGDTEDGSFEQHRDLWNRAFAMLGLPPLPDAVDAETLPLAVDLLLGTIEPNENDTTDPDDPTKQAATTGAGVQTLPALTPAIGANMPAELANTFAVLFGGSAVADVLATTTTPAGAATPAVTAAKPPVASAADPQATAAVNLANMIQQMAERSIKQDETIAAMTTQMANLANTVTALQTEKQANVEAAYKSKLATLATQLKITAEEVTMFTNIGPSIGWNLANLAALDGRPSFASTQRFAKPGASGAAPAVAGVVEEMKSEDILQGVNMLLRPLGKTLKELPAA